MRAVKRDRGAPRCHGGAPVCQSCLMPASTRGNPVRPCCQARSMASSDRHSCTHWIPGLSVPPPSLQNWFSMKYLAPEGVLGRKAVADPFFSSAQHRQQDSRPPIEPKSLLRAETPVVMIRPCQDLKSCRSKRPLC